MRQWLAHESCSVVVCEQAAVIHSERHQSTSTDVLFRFRLSVRRAISALSSEKLEDAHYQSGVVRLAASVICVRLQQILTEVSL